MKPPPIPPDEPHRLAALRALRLLDSGEEERFHRITRLAQRLLDAPMAAVTLVDEDVQWFKSRQGLGGAPSTPREESFCAHAINGDDCFVVGDATTDDRFADHPAVTAGDLRFYAGYPFAGPDGSKLGAICVLDVHPRTVDDADVAVLRDLAGMVEHEIAAMQLAISDELTGLSNRRGFALLGAKVLDVCARLQVPATLVFADLDGLKRINDTLGHDAGDEAIRAAADLLATNFRSSDVIARLGGDEFAFLLAGTRSADDVEGRLRDAVADAAIARFELAMSVGTAVFEPASPVSLDELLAAADAAMYVDKEARRAAR